MQSYFAPAGSRKSIILSKRVGCREVHQLFTPRQKWVRFDRKGTLKGKLTVTVAHFDDLENGNRPRLPRTRSCPLSYPPTPFPRALASSSTSHHQFPSFTAMRSLRELARFATQTRSLAPAFRVAPVAAASASFAQTRVFTMSAPSSVEVDAYKVGDSTNIKWHEGSVDSATRAKALGQKGCVLWFTGLSGSGKSTVAYTLEHALFQRGKIAQVLDGDNIRHGLNSNVDFSPAGREENIRRIGEVSKLFADSGMITLVSFISPYRKDRDDVRKRVGDGKFVEVRYRVFPKSRHTVCPYKTDAFLLQSQVYMKIPLAVCEERDPKGLYKAARAGKIKGFTGIDDPYEEPLCAEIVMEVAKEGGDGTLAAPEKMAAAIIAVLEEKGYLTA